MAKGKFKNNGRKEYKDMSGNDNYPGQFRLDLDKGEMVEQRQQLCKPYYSQRYWEAFRDFLAASGVFGRTWHLYKQIKADPDPEELSAEIERTDSKSVKQRLLDHQKDVVDRITVMKTRQKCESLDELYKKAEDDWNAYKKALRTLISYSKNANVPIDAKEGSKVFRNIMLSFVLLDDHVRGSCRREYYRSKFVIRSLNQIKKIGYADPVSIYKIEAEFQADKEWQERFLRRKKKT